MYEWTLDFWDNDRFDNPCSDCSNLTPPPIDLPRPEVSVRGGDFNMSCSPPTCLSPPYRNNASPGGHNDDIGFRCARVP